MEYRSALVVGISLALVSSVVASSSACSSSSSSGTTTPAAGDGGITVAADLCKKTGDYESCFACCNPGIGYLASTQTFQTCMCQGACKAPCADSICVTDPDASAAEESDACDNCLNTDPSAKSCSEQAQTTCNQDADCVRFTACINDACEQLPDSDAGH
jgi:hypothetical protein